jgi:hypothetical protein
VHRAVTKPSAQTPRALLAGLIVFSAGALGYMANVVTHLGVSEATVHATPPARAESPATPAASDAPADDARRKVPDRELRRTAAHGEFLGHMVCALPARDPTAQ